MITKEQPFSVKEAYIPVIVRCSSGWIACFTISFGDTWIGIRSLSYLPAPGELCDVVLQFREGQVSAKGRVVGVNVSQNQCTIDLTQLEDNGEILLGFLTDIQKFEEVT